MNEVSMVQMLSYFTANWWYVLPALFCGASIALGIGNILAHMAYKYVYEKAGTWDLSHYLTEKVTGEKLVGVGSSNPYFRKQYDRHSVGYVENWDWDDVRPWYCLDWGHSKYIDVGMVWTFAILLWPSILLAVLGILYLLPMPLFYASLTAFGILHAARISVRTSRKIMAKLKAHVDDKDAHK